MQQTDSFPFIHNKMDTMYHRQTNFHMFFLQAFNQKSALDRLLVMFMT